MMTDQDRDRREAISYMFKIGMSRSQVIKVVVKMTGSQYGAYDRIVAMIADDELAVLQDKQAAAVLAGKSHRVKAIQHHINRLMDGQRTTR